MFLFIVKSRFIQSVTGIRYYRILNTIVDSFDPIKIRPFDHGEVLVNKEIFFLFHFVFLFFNVFSIMINLLKMYLFECIHQRMCLKDHHHRWLYSFMVVDSFLEVFVSCFFPKKNVFIYLYRFTWYYELSFVDVYRCKSHCCEVSRF